MVSEVAVVVVVDNFREKMERSASVVVVEERAQESVTVLIGSC